MKNRKLMVCVIVILSTVTLKSFGSSPVDGSIKIIKSYIDSYVNNNPRLMKNMLADGATLKLSRGETLIVQSKESIIDFMHDSGKMTQNCDAKYEVLSTSSAMVIARIDFDYPNATHHNYLILEKNADKEWKITSIFKMISDKDSASPYVPIANN